VRWDRWFEAFDRLGLALLVDNNTGTMSRRCELVPRAPDRKRTGAARRRRFAPDGNQPVGGRARSAALKPAAEEATRRQPLRKLVKALSRRPVLPPASGTPGPARRVKSKAVPKPIRAPRSPK